jgi:hypothetical protein
MKTGDKVSIHYQDIDNIGYGDSINTDGIVIREQHNGTVLVEYKDEYTYWTKQREFYPHDLTPAE